MGESYCALRARRYGLQVRGEREPGAKGRDLGIRIGAVIAVAAAVAFVAWLVIRHNDSSNPSAGATSTATSTTQAPKQQSVVAAEVQSLKTLAAFLNRPIYWFGPRARTTYELTQTPDGKIYIRYLPRGVKIGDRSGQYPLVGTYPVQNGYKAVQTAGQQAGAQTFAIPRGGLAVVNDAAPTNVYFAYPGTDQQVEVFDPNPARARRLVATGAVRPIR